MSVSPTPFPVVLFHNPDCSKSRAVLAAIREAGLEPQLIDYRDQGWSRPLLQTLFAAAGLSPREALRDADTLPEATSDDAILDIMISDPARVQRPFVVTPRGTRLCRPPETVAALLP